MVPITVHAGVVGVIERIHDAVLDQRADAVFAEFVAEGFRVVFFKVVEWMSVMYSVSTSTRAVTFNARTR